MGTLIGEHGDVKGMGMGMSLRMMAVLALAVAAAGLGQAGGVGQAAAGAGGRRVLLWPDGAAGANGAAGSNGAPGAKGSADSDRPSLTVFLPAQNPTKTGVVIAPGGGYAMLAIDKEGYAFARWLNARGVAAFVLQYRLGPVYHHPLELGDAQRAIRMVRANAAAYGVRTDHVGMMGSSAGGHLAATAGTHFDAGRADARDAIERQGSRPDFLVLAYPVITLMDPEAHRGSRNMLLGAHADPALVRSLSAQTGVTKDTPPTFLFATTDDNVVPVRNSVEFYAALVKAGVPAEMHLFQKGPHGVGLAADRPELSVWSDLLIKWMRERGYAGAQPDSVPERR